jgi:glyceraldehyde 3-phosphate dehydrogenase
MRVLINGFGRIGRSVLRASAEGRWPGVEIAAVNDIAGLETAAYLFQYDSTFGPYRGTVEERAGALVVDGREIAFSAEADLAACDLSGFDLVMDCTGKAKDRAIPESLLAAGAGKVAISGPCETADLTVVIGANDEALSDQRIVSNASCTTNALAPLLRLLDEAYGVEAGWMTTIHCYTGSQPTIDAPRGGSLARSRAAALSMVPTSTSAERLTGIVLPHLAGRVEGRAVRVPVASVSAVDLSVHTRQRPGAEAVNALLVAAARARPRLFGVTERPLVSSDLRQSPQSIVMALPETCVTKGGRLWVFGWYDTEWGLANRRLDLAARMDGGAPRP